MRTFSLVATLIVAAGAWAQTPAFADRVELLGVTKIWDQAPHSAFGDIIRFRDRWYAVFREGTGHVPDLPGHNDDGKLRVLVSKDGVRWTSAALIADEGVDLRDPHLSITADGRLMIVAGGSIYDHQPGARAKYMGRRPRVSFSANGTEWTKPEAVLSEGHWLWRVTWHKGKGYGVSKHGSIGGESASNPKRVTLVETTDGVRYETVAELSVPAGDETTVRFLPDDSMVALVRREDAQGAAWIGHSKPPYKEWSWKQAAFRVGGPNFIVLPHGDMWGGGRLYIGDKNLPSHRTVLARMTTSSYEPVLVLPSGGDNSYPGFYWYKDTLWMLYYSSHEGKAGIYVARIRLPR